MKLPVLAVGLLLAALLAACDDDSDDEVAGPAPSATATVTLSPVPTATATLALSPTATATFSPVPTPTTTPLPSSSATATPGSTPPSTPSPTAVPSETPTPRSDLTVASLNILHGLTCPPETEFCRLADRVELFFQWIVAAGCPDFVNVQEVLGGVLALVREKAGSACPFPYEIVESSKSQNIVLSRYPVLASRTESLHGGVRLVLHVRVDHPIGPVDVFTTHLAASIDGGNAPCGPVCPEECIGAGAATNRDCQAVQVRRFVEETHDLGTPAVVTGDFNAPPGSFVYEQFVGAGWIDAYLEAGNPECEPATGVGCTSGRQDENLVDMESPENGVDERIDFAFVVPPREPAICNFEIDPAEDADGDGLGTRIFADLPNPFVPECGPRPLPICWPSDHEGMQVDLNCLP